MVKRRISDIFGITTCYFSGKYTVKNVKETFVKALIFLGILPKEIIKVVGIFMCEILLPKHCMSVVNKELFTKDVILYTEYSGMKNTRAAMYEVPLYVKWEALAVYPKQYSQIINISSDHKHGK